MESQLEVFLVGNGKVTNTLTLDASMILTVEG